MGKCRAPVPEPQEALQKEASALIQDILQALKQYWTAVKSDWQQEDYTPDAYMQATKDFMKLLKCCKGQDKDFMLPWTAVKKLIHALKQATMVEEAPSTEGEALLQAVLGAAKRHWWAAKCWKPKAMGKAMGKGMGKCWAPVPEHADWWAAKKAMAKGMGKCRAPVPEPQEALQKEASALIQDIMQALKQYWTAVKSDWQQEDYTPDDFMKFLKCCKGEDKDFMLPSTAAKKLIHALKQ